MTIGHALALLMLFLVAQNATADQWELKLGPPGVGNGGTNPITFQAIDYELTYLSGDYQFSASIFPGLFVGPRFYDGLLFGSLGGGLAISGNGIGPGVYTSLGLSTAGKKGHGFVVEYKQAFGVGEVLLFPYALRFGVAVEL